MANYPLTAMNKDHTFLRSQSTLYSDEYAERMCELFLRDCIVKDEHGNHHQYYRLHAEQAHNTEMALAYTIQCPKCRTGTLKQIGAVRTFNELGLYRCPVCDKK